MKIVSTVGQVGYGFFSQSVIQTLSYFDIFDYPLTREELFYFLWEPKENFTYAQFLLALEKEIKESLADIVETQGGYYFFAGKSDCIAKRERKILYTEEKLAIAKRAAKKIRYIPFVLSMFVCNQLPVGVKKTSDIDVFIVIRRQYLWFSRACITALMIFFRLRRNKKNTEDLICLSFYVTDDHLDLSDICISSPDVYQAHWMRQLISVYDPDDFHEQIREKNPWVKKYLPNSFFSYTLLDRWKVYDSSLSRKIKKSLEWILSFGFGMFLERVLRSFQKKKMKCNEDNENFRATKNVVISDTMLKFHENDRKQYFKTEWEKRVHKFLG